MSSESADRRPNDSVRSDLAVMDANEFKQKHRLKRILEAHDRVEEKFAEAYERHVKGNVSEHGKNIIMLRAVQSFIREIHNLLMDYGDELDKQTDGDETVPNPYWHGMEDNELGVVEFETEPNKVFHGLKDVVESDEVYEETWQVRVPKRHVQHEIRRERAEHTVPEKVSKNAFILAKMFLARQYDLEMVTEQIEDQRPISDWREDEL